MSELDKKVLDAITQRRLTPRPAFYFLAWRSVFWTLAVLSLLLGAISVAVIIFATKDYVATGGAGFDQMPLDDLFATLPFVWLATFPLFVASAVYSIRQTRRGYRFRASHVVLAAILASVAIGGLLHVLDVGKRVHHFLAEKVSLYRSVTRIGEPGWGTPDQGYLRGRAIKVDGTSRLTLVDIDGTVWTVDASSAEITADALASGEDLAVRGERTGPATFRATSIRDWD